MNCLFCFACVGGFYFTCETAFISAHELSHLYPSNSLPCPTGEVERVSSRVVLSYWLGLNNSTVANKVSNNSKV